MATEALAPRRVAHPTWIGLAGAAVLVAIGARIGGLTDSVAMSTFSIIFIAIVIEALPFVLVGAIVSALIAVFISDQGFARLARLPAFLQVPAAALAGFAFPVCECGSVPVARRLIGRGIHPAAGITFMLASPVLNPIVLLSTWVAYSPRGLAPQMMAGRAVLGLVVAAVIGWALGAGNAAELLRARSRRPSDPDDPSCHVATGTKPARLLEHVLEDFFFMGKFLLIGAALAAAMQTLIPQSLLGGIATTPLVSAVTLMAIAYISSLCSEGDAFVAVSFAQFPLGAQLAFLTFGPVLDFKLTFLYGASFRQKFPARLAAVAVPVVLAGSLWFEVLAR